MDTGKLSEVTDSFNTSTVAIAARQYLLYVQIHQVYTKHVQCLCISFTSVKLFKNLGGGNPQVEQSHEVLGTLSSLFLHLKNSKSPYYIVLN